MTRLRGDKFAAGLRERAPIAGLTLLAAVLRFATLDRQSFWSDEAITVLLVRMDLGGMLSTVAETESTPPVYYVLAWVWARVFGDGEIGLRSLSALAGVATVPVAYLAGAALFGRRAGIAAATLVAVSPPLVWYSQEARSYAVAVLLVGVSFAALARVRGTPSRSVLGLWATASALAVGTHYFAAFVVGAEAIWLVSLCRRAVVYRAVAAVGACCLAVAPLALKQRGNGFAEYFGIAGGSVGERSVVLGKQFLVGHALPADRVAAFLVATCLVVSVWLLFWRGGRAERRSALVAASCGGAAIVVPVLLATLGLDYLNTRNALVGFVPLAVVAPAGLALSPRRRLAGSALVTIAVGLVAVSVLVAVDPAYHRPNWRGLAQAVDGADVARAVVVTPDHLGWFARVPLQVYLPEARAVDARLAPTPPQFFRIGRRPQDRATPSRVIVREVVVAAVGWELPILPRELPAEFDEIEERVAVGYRLVRRRSARPLSVPVAALVAPRSVVVAGD